MAGFTPKAWVARLLEATAGRTAISTSTVYLGLALSVPDTPEDATLANIGEVTTAGYARKAVPAFSAATTTGTYPSITTPTQFQFDAFTADMALAAPYAFLCDAAAGTSGAIRHVWELPQAIKAVAGVPVTIPASTLIIE